MDIVNPVSAYFFLSDDAQDEISGEKKENMKCQSCGHRFAGETYESCPECFSPDTEEAADEKDDRYW
jgi:rubrerythrin